MKQPEFHASKPIVVTSTRPSHSSRQQTTKNNFQVTQKMPTMEDLTTRLFPSSLRPVSFRYDTTTGSTSTKIATKSTRPGMDRSFVLMAFGKTGRDAIQSWVSVPFKRSTTNSFIEKVSRLANREWQSAGGNAASSRDQMWGTPRAWHGTYFKTACKSLYQNIRTPMQRHYSWIWTSRIQNFPQNCRL